MATLFVLGNGFDLHHGLPTKYDPDLKKLAIRAERYRGEWESYRIDGDLWSDVEAGLAHPDLESVLEHLEQFAPDYLSERESDREGIVFEAEQLLDFPLEEFARHADAQLDAVRPSSEFADVFGADDCFITFNYTHTLERLYGVDPSRILHVHGAVDEGPLILGYTPGSLRTTEVLHEWDREENFDHYRSTAHDVVERRVRQFEKVYQTTAVLGFLRQIPVPPERVIIFGHSLSDVDKPYFAILQEHVGAVGWTVFTHTTSGLGDVHTAFDRWGLDVEYEALVH